MPVLSQVHTIDLGDDTKAIMRVSPDKVRLYDPKSGQLIYTLNMNTDGAPLDSLAFFIACAYQGLSMGGVLGNA